MSTPYVYFHYKTSSNIYFLNKGNKIVDSKSFDDNSLKFIKISTLFDQGIPYNDGYYSLMSDVEYISTNERGEVNDTTCGKPAVMSMTSRSYRRYKNGVLHCDNGPAIEVFEGDVCVFKAFYHEGLEFNRLNRKNASEDFEQWYTHRYYIKDNVGEYSFDDYVQAMSKSQYGMEKEFKKYNGQSI